MNIKTSSAISRGLVLLFIVSVVACQKSNSPDESEPVDINTPTVLVPTPSQPGQQNPQNPSTGPIPTPPIPTPVSPNTEITGEGYYIASYVNGATDGMQPIKPIDFTKGVHLIIVGEAEAIGMTFLESATTRAKRWAEVYPGEQIVLIAHNESGGQKMRAQLATWGWENINYRRDQLGPQSLFMEMNPFRKIESFDMFSHSYREGALLSHGDYLDISNEDYDGVDWSLLKTSFTSNSFAMFFGCNNGFRLAPFLSGKWQIPVAGTLTSSDLQHLHSSGQFYAYNENTKPSTGNWSLTNTKSFLQSLSCESGACMRMKPDPFPYSGTHGTYAQGLPFYKFFCVNNSADDCAQRMARALLAWPSMKPLRPTSSRSDWKFALADFMCPIHATRTLRDDCLAQMPKIEAGESQKYVGSFMGRELACDWQSCTEGATPPALQNNSTFVREYQRYLKGLTLLGIL